MGGAQCNGSVLHQVALLAFWGGVLRRSWVRMRMRGRSANGVSHLPSLFSLFSPRPQPAFSLSVTRPRAVPLSRVLSQTRLFSPAPYF